MNTCKTCEYWARLGERDGQCLGLETPDNLVKLFMYRRNKRGHWIAIDDAVEDPGYKAGMITDASFGCKLWVPKE